MTAPPHPSLPVSQKSTLGQRREEKHAGPGPCQDAGLAGAVAGPCPVQPRGTAAGTSCHLEMDGGGPGSWVGGGAGR